ncbi:MAG: hypothetical protein PVI06_14425 [Desulfobacterales bacterium]|jgi:hypothetical protein
MNKSVKIVCLEELERQEKYREGYLNRRREKNAYLENPSYRHPIYGTPLMEPYKPSAKAVDGDTKESG